MTEVHTGTGRLAFGASDELCQYHLEITPSRALKSGSGFVVSTPEALQACFTARRARVIMKDGRSFPIILTEHSPGWKDAPFQLAGAIE